MDDQVRRNREKFVIDMRKTQRDEIFKLSRKRLAEITNSTNKNPQIIVDDRFKDIISQYLQIEYDSKHLQYYCNRLNSEDIEAQHEAVIAVRQIISEESSQRCIQEVVDLGLVPLLISLMKQIEYPQLQFEACWIVTNIAAGSNAQCESIVEKGCIEALLQLIYLNRPYLNQQALWGLGNIAGDCAKFRDQILMKGGHQCLQRLVESSTSKTVIRQGVWALSNLCRGAPLPKYEIIKPIIPLLCKTISADILHGDELLDALWSIANNSEGQKSKIQRIIEVHAFPPKLLALCATGEFELMTPCLRIIGNISVGNQSQTEVLLQLNVLQLLEGLLDHEKKIIRREACWIISNICAGTKRQIAQVLARPSLLYRVTLLFIQDHNDIKKEICYIFANMCHLGDVKTVYALLMDLKVMDTLLSLIMQDQDIRLLEIALTALFDILALGERVAQPNPAVLLMNRTMGCSERLESLQRHESNEVYRSVLKILQRFFTLQEENII